MNWYYSENGQQRGPVDDTQLDQLAAAGTVTPDTLVWSEGMANWLPYAQARPIADAAPVGAGMVVCGSCGGTFAADDVMRLENRFVCQNCKPIILQQLREGAITPAAGEFQYAGFWVRFIAKFIDGLIIMIPMYALNFGLALAMFGVLIPQLDPNDMALFFVYQGLTIVLNTAIYMLYSGFFLGRFGATPGKMALGLKVIRPDGSGLTFWRGAVRYLGEFVSSMICLIGYIIAAFDDEKRALHDRMCDTRVVKK